MTSDVMRVPMRKEKFFFFLKKKFINLKKQKKHPAFRGEVLGGGGKGDLRERESDLGGVREGGGRVSGGGVNKSLGVPVYHENPFETCRLFF